MQVIYGDASNINLTAQKRLLRVVEGQTQATPFAGVLDASLRNTTGGIRVPDKGDKAAVVGPDVGTGEAAAASPFTRTTTAKTLEGSLLPSLCVVKTAGEGFAVAAGAASENVFGLLGQWVGGVFDNIKTSNQISAWQGVDSYYDVLAPGYDPLELSAAISSENAKGKPVYLTSGKDGRLVLVGTANTSNTQKVAEAIELSGSVLRIRLLV